mgnify:CR=1 FL=1
MNAKMIKLVSREKAFLNVLNTKGLPQDAYNRASDSLALAQQNISKLAFKLITGA